MKSWPVMNKPEILVIILIYLVACFVIGIVTGKMNKSSDDFYTGGRKVGIALMIFGTFSASMSGFGFVGGPGMAYNGGFNAMWLCMMQPLMFFVTWVLVGRKFIGIADRRNILSFADLCYARFPYKTTKVIVAIVCIVGSVAYVATNILSLGYVISACFGISMALALTIGCGILLFYSIAGGIMAALYTDVIQGAAMLVGAIIIVGTCFGLGDGMGGIVTAIASEDTKFIGLFGTSAAMYCLSYQTMCILGNTGLPSVSSRFYMLDDPKKLKWSCFGSGAGYMVTSLLILTLGLFMRAETALGHIEPIENSDTVSIVFLLNYVHPIIAGVVFAALLGAIMSTVDAFLNIGSSAITRDLVPVFRKDGKQLEGKQELLVARIAVCIILAAGLFVALNTKTALALLGATSAGLFMAPLASMVILGLNWKRCTAKGAIAGSLCGLAFAITFEILKALGIFVWATGVQSTCLGMFIAISVTILVSLTSKEGDCPEDLKIVINS